MPIRDLQLRLRELGRIRLGQKGDRGQPQKLDRFRITGPHRDIITRCAELYGGTVRDWTPQGGSPGYEVVTDATAIPVVVPPNNAYSQWLELWSGGGCQRRCDGQRETLGDTACICKANEADECKPTTRLNVMLREVAALGVFRLETHGWNAAAELPAMADLCARFGRDLPATLTLEQRTSKSGGQTRQFMVPGLVPQITPDQLVTGAQTPTVALPTAAPVAALTTGVDYLVLAADATTADEVRGLWTDAAAAAALTDELKAALTARAADLTAERESE